MNINFLEETLACLRSYGKKEEDVLWAGRGVGGFQDKEPYKTTWEDFKAKADFCYDNGYGIEEIPEDIIVAGKDFWLERNSYDGQEWWEFKSMPREPEVIRELDLGGGGWPLMREVRKRYGNTYLGGK